jgi:hypothetical protein
MERSQGSVRNIIYCEEAYEILGNIYRRIIGQLGDNACLQKEMIYIIFLRKNNL